MKVAFYGVRHDPHCRRVVFVSYDMIPAADADGSSSSQMIPTADGSSSVPHFGIFELFRKHPAFRNICWFLCRWDTRVWRGVVVMAYLRNVRPNCHRLAAAGQKSVVRGWNHLISKLSCFRAVFREVLRSGEDPRPRGCEIDQPTPNPPPPI